MLNLENVKLKATEVEGAQRLLASYPDLTQKTLPKCSLDEVRALLKVELDTKRRPTTYARLLARFNSLEAQSNSKEMEEYISKHRG